MSNKSIIKIKILFYIIMIIVILIFCSRYIYTNEVKPTFTDALTDYIKKDICNNLDMTFNDYDNIIQNFDKNDEDYYNQFIDKYSSPLFYVENSMGDKKAPDMQENSEEFINNDDLNKLISIFDKYKQIMIENVLDEIPNSEKCIEK